MADFDAQRKARLEAMADKKRRLEELKKMRQEKMADSAAVAPVVSSMEQLSVKENKKAAEIDNILSSILTTDTPKAENVDTVAPAQAEASDAVHASALLEDKRKALCTCKPVIHFVNAPVLVESYDKEVQTDSVAVGSDSSEEDGDEDAPAKVSRSTSSTNRKSCSPVKKRTSSEHVVQEAEASTGTVPAAPASATNAAHVVAAALNTSNTDFSAFLQKTSKYAERALAQSESFDICVDYRSVEASSGQVDATTGSSMNVALQWSPDADVFKHRPVLSIFNNISYNELYGVSYGARVNKQKSVNIHESGDPSGVLAVWSTVTPGTPELVCYSSSSHILVGKFNPHNPKQIIGGCYNGQIVLWDITAGNGSGSPSEMLLPVQRSSLSGKGCHRYAIVNFSIIETSIGNSATGKEDKDNTMVELVSVSADGLICHWDLSSLIEPTRSYYYNGMSSASSNVESLSSLSCLSFITSNKLEADDDQAYSFGGGDAVVGTEHGKLYQVNCPAPKTLSVTSKFPQIDAHFGMVSKMHMHPSNMTTHRSSGKFVGMNQLLLTIALDWRVKLWDTGVLSRPTVGATKLKAGAASTGLPTLSTGLLFEFVNPSYDYVSDIQWSPMHPAIFACITSNNTLYIWNVMVSSTEPTDTVVIPSTLESPGSTDSTVACTQLEWNPNGKQIYVGNSAGVVYTVQLKDSVVAHRPADDSKFEALINQKRKTGGM